MSYSIFTRSHDVFLSEIAALTAMAERGELTKEGLSAAVDRYYDDGDYIDRSIGTIWITDHPELFARVVPEGERLTFLRAHLDRAHCAELLICYPKVLETLPLPQRSTYVFEAYGRCGARNGSWVAAALEAEVPKGELVLALMYRLETAAPSKGRSSYSAFRDFLHCGNDSLSGQSLWGICTTEEFHSLVMICAVKDPVSVFEFWQKLRGKLSAETVSAILAVAAPCLEHCPDAVDGVMQLPPKAREDFLRRLTPDRYQDSYMRLLVQVVVAADDSKALFTELRQLGRFNGMDPVDAFLKAAAIGELRQDLPAARMVLGFFRERLEAAGYRVAKLKRQQYYDRKSGQNKWQLCVDVGQLRYVMGRDSHRYFLSEGEEVLFRLRGGVRLTPQVIAAHFIPTAPNRRR